MKNLKFRGKIILPTGILILTFITAFDTEGIVWERTHEPQNHNSLAERSQEASAQTTDLIQDSINRVTDGAGIAETTASSEELNAQAQALQQLVAFFKV